MGKEDLAKLATLFLRMVLMGTEFIPTLIQTITWTPFYWETLRIEMSKQVKEFAKNRDYEGLFKLVNHEFYTFNELERDLEDFCADITTAKGAVAVKSETYQEVILRLLDVE